MYGVSGYTDTATILTDLATLLPAAGWSTVAANRYKSPPTAAGRCMDIAFASISAAQLGMTVRNWLGATLVERRMNISTGAPGSAVRYFYGSHHLVIDCQTSVEYVAAFVLDPSPMADTDVMVSSVVAWGTRTAAGANDGAGRTLTWAFVNPLTGAVVSGVVALYTPTPISVNRARNINLDYMFFPCVVGVVAYPYAGVFCQALFGDSGTIAQWTNVNVPLGDGTTGVFMRISPLADYGVGIFMRVS
jgi:hypothetical protein